LIESERTVSGEVEAQ